MRSEDPVLTTQEEQSASEIKTDKLILYRQIMVCCSEIHTKKQMYCGLKT